MSGRLAESRSDERVLFTAAISLALVFLFVPVAGDSAWAFTPDSPAFALPGENSLTPLPVVALGIGPGGDFGSNESAGRRAQPAGSPVSSSGRVDFHFIAPFVILCIALFDTTFRRHFREVCQLLDLPPPCLSWAV